MNPSNVDFEDCVDASKLEKLAAASKRRAKNRRDAESDDADDLPTTAEEVDDSDDGDDSAAAAPKDTKAKKKGTTAAEKKKLKNKRLREDVREWMIENKSEVKKLKKAPAKTGHSAAINLDTVTALKKEFMKKHKKKEDEVHLTHILPLLMFLRKTSIVLEGIGEFDAVFKGKTTAGEDYVKEIERMICAEKDNGSAADGDEDEDMKISLSVADADALMRKYGKKWWKLPKQGQKGKQRYSLRPHEDPRRFLGKRKVKVTLVDVAASLAEVSDKRTLAFISPILHYEYV
jgi:hypothetical protein